MTKEFKVGDKVTCITNGKGIVKSIDNNITYAVGIKFDSLYYKIGYTKNGNHFESTQDVSLYHGHGTFKIEFIEDKEPEYEWQWLYKYKGVYDTTTFYKTYEEMFKTFVKYDEVIEVIKRIEQSKKEVT